MIQLWVEDIKESIKDNVMDPIESWEIINNVRKQKYSTQKTLTRLKQY